MLLKVDYVYGDNGVIENGLVIVNAEITESMSHSEVNNILKPLIRKESGHTDIKIISYGEV